MNVHTTSSCPVYIYIKYSRYGCVCNRQEISYRAVHSTNFNQETHIYEYGRHSFKRVLNWDWIADQSSSNQEKCLIDNSLESTSYIAAVECCKSHNWAMVSILNLAVLPRVHPSSHSARVCSRLHWPNPITWVFKQGEWPLETSCRGGVDHSGSREGASDHNKQQVLDWLFDTLGNAIGMDGTVLHPNMSLPRIEDRVERDKDGHTVVGVDVPSNSSSDHQHLPFKWGMLKEVATATWLVQIPCWAINDSPSGTTWVANALMQSSTTSRSYVSMTHHSQVWV